MNAAARLVEVRVPDMGNFKDVAVIDVLVKPGESIEPEAPLVTLETEKATMDVPSTASGVIEKVHVSKGGTVSPGDLIVTVRAAAPDSPAAGAAAAGKAGGGLGPPAGAPPAAASSPARPPPPGGRPGRRRPRQNHKPPRPLHLLLRQTRRHRRRCPPPPAPPLKPS